MAANSELQQKWLRLDREITQLENQQDQVAKAIASKREARDLLKDFAPQSTPAAAPAAAAAPASEAKK